MKFKRPETLTATGKSGKKNMKRIGKEIKCQ